MAAPTSLSSLLFGVANRALDLLYPPQCVICSRGCVWLCAACRDSFTLLGSSVCVRCGVPLTPGTLCTRCQTHPLDIDSIRSVYQFEGKLRDTLLEFKYSGLRVLAHPLGDLMGRQMEKYPVPVDTVVPVPLHARRHRSRGFNQSALLAHHLGRVIGKPVVLRSLVRQRETAPQVSLGAAERRANVQDAFVCINDALQDRDLLLVDDVCTTGATLEACGVALRKVGAKSIHAFTLARTVAA